MCTFSPLVHAAAYVVKPALAHNCTSHSTCVATRRLPGTGRACACACTCARVCVLRRGNVVLQSASRSGNVLSMGAAQCYPRVRPKVATGTTILNLSADLGIRAHCGTDWGASCAQGPSMAAPQLNSGDARAQQHSKATCSNAHVNGATHAYFSPRCWPPHG